MAIVPQSIVYGSPPELGERAQCQVRRNSEVIFHTHPRTSYSVPSIEDINKPFRHRSIKTSVLATNWGVYQIVKLAEHTFPQHILDAIRQSIDNINKATVNPLYRQVRTTPQARGVTKNTEWNLLTPNQQAYVVFQLDTINRLLDGYGWIAFRQEQIIVADV